MGRGKVQLKRIENKNSRMVTFSKRRSGLMKKASELAILCDVEIAVVVFSEKGKLYEFCSKNSLKKILENYQIHLLAEEEVRSRVHNSKNHQAEIELPWAGSTLVQTVQRCLNHDNIERLNTRELTQLEELLDSTLRQTKTRKKQLIMERILALQDKEKELREENQLIESEIAAVMSEENAARRPVEVDHNAADADAVAAATDTAGNRGFFPSAYPLCI